MAEIRSYKSKAGKDYICGVPADWTVIVDNMAARTDAVDLAENGYLLLVESPSDCRGAGASIGILRTAKQDRRSVELLSEQDGGSPPSQIRTGESVGLSYTKTFETVMDELPMQAKLPPVLTKEVKAFFDVGERTFRISFQVPANSEKKYGPDFDRLLDSRCWLGKKQEKAP